MLRDTMCAIVIIGEELTHSMTVGYFQTVCERKLSDWRNSKRCFEIGTSFICRIKVIHMRYRSVTCRFQHIPLLRRHQSILKFQTVILWYLLSRIVHTRCKTCCKKMCWDVIVISCDGEKILNRMEYVFSGITQKSSHSHFPYTFSGTEYPSLGIPNPTAGLNIPQRVLQTLLLGWISPRGYSKPYYWVEIMGQHTHARAHVHTRTHTHGHTYTHVHTRTGTRTRTHGHTYTHVHTRTGTRTHTCTHARAHVHARTGTRTHTYIH